MTICSSMLCFNRAEPTNDPAHPPFCDKCKKKVATQKVRVK